MKLLIVDDNAAMRAMVRSMAADSTDKVFECSNGTEALSSFKQTHPDFVCMDIQMSGINGIETTRKITKEFPDAKVIIVSNYKDQEFRDEAAEAGAVSYFTKDDLTALRAFIHQSS
ncbi:MAG: response regulator transcription factor [Bacteroidetes bacterium]|nr:response regulator transcription factor [Bacteroidota bacterium]